uniref:SPW repeat domain-containing protein n=1 Tax=Pontibacter pamirensis TaxID=2562824 RepID=UPI001F262AE4|nr:SPW repeat protein [Pontibacter pamirensis]
MLIASPWLIGFKEVEVASWTAVLAGVLVFMQTAFTDIEVGIVKKTSMSTHLMFDVFIGVILAVSPLLFDFAQRIYMPHLIFGLYLILSAFITHRVPAASYQTTEPEIEGWEN